MALQHKPDYLPAYLGIAQIWAGISQMGIVPHAEAYPKMKKAEVKALEQDIKSAELHYPSFQKFLIFRSVEIGTIQTQNDLVFIANP